MQSNDLHYIYQWDDPRDLSVIYIGLTSNLSSRMHQHRGNSKGVLYPWIQELKQLGLEPIVYCIDQVHGLDVARDREKQRIQERKPLLNTLHNKAVLEETQEAEAYQTLIADLMRNRGFSFRESVLYLKYFDSQGGATEYNTIRWTAQLVRKMSGEVTPFTESEILSIAIQHIKQPNDYPQILRYVEEDGYPAKCVESKSDLALARRIPRTLPDSQEDERPF